MIQYNIDILAELRRRGYDSRKIRESGLLSQSTISAIRQGGNINTATINKICLILRLQPSDIISVVPTDEEKIKYF